MSDKELSPQEKAVKAINDRIKSFLKECERRDGGEFKIEHIDTDASGMPTTLSGTITNAGEDKKAVTEQMVWNTTGKSLSQNVGFDLVVKIAIKDFTK